MSARHRVLIAIEKNELRFWKLARRLLRRARGRGVATGARLDGGLATAMEWAEDAIRSRREELVVLRARAKVRERGPASRRAAPVATPEPSPRLAA